MYTKFKIRQNLSVVLEVTIVVILREGEVQWGVGVSFEVLTGQVLFPDMGVTEMHLLCQKSAIVWFAWMYVIFQ